MCNIDECMNSESLFHCSTKKILWNYNRVQRTKVIVLLLGKHWTRLGTLSFYAHLLSIELYYVNKLDLSLI